MIKLKKLLLEIHNSLLGKNENLDKIINEYNLSSGYYEYFPGKEAIGCQIEVDDIPVILKKLNFHIDKTLDDLQKCQLRIQYAFLRLAVHNSDWIRFTAIGKDRFDNEFWYDIDETGHYEVFMKVDDRRLSNPSDFEGNHTYMTIIRKKLVDELQPYFNFDTTSVKVLYDEYEGYNTFRVVNTFQYDKESDAYKKFEFLEIHSREIADILSKYNCREHEIYLRLHIPSNKYKIDIVSTNNIPGYMKGVDNKPLDEIVLN